MASAQVMTMVVDGGAVKERQAAEETAAAQDVYVKLKTLKKHMEFLDIQVSVWLCWSGVGCCGVRVCEAGLGGRVWGSRWSGSLDFGISFTKNKRDRYQARGSQHYVRSRVLYELYQRYR